MSVARTPAGPLRAVAEELRRAGVRDVVICPGSRSTPLALALRAAPGLRTWVHIDERVGGFFALGAARASRRPVAVLVTSGTAAAELLPAVVEASTGRVPLIVLTADRPPELRDRGASQAIDQERLFGRFPRWYAELPVPAEDETTESQVRSTVGRAVAVSMTTPAGPVHLNAPLREPLVPDGSLAADDAALGLEAAHTSAIAGVRRVHEPDLALLAEQLLAQPRGVIVCGPLDAPGFASAVARLAAATGYPIVADLLSNVRFGAHDREAVVTRADAILRSSAAAQGLRPQVIMRFGATPVSRVILEWIAGSGARQVVVDDGGWADPTLLPVTMVHAHPVAFIEDLADLVTPAGTDVTTDWLEQWQAVERAATMALGGWLDALDEPFEGAVVASLARALPALPPGTLLVAGNSKPVRDLDVFLGTGPADIRCLGNRGASGIDGVLSTALGAAAVAGAPVVAVVGDLSLVHDLGALVAAQRLGISATVVLVDNDGGGIFSQLPQAGAQRPDVGLPEHFEELLGTPHGLDLAPVVTALGASHRLVRPDEVGAAVAASFAEPGLKVVAVRTDRARDAELHRAAFASVRDALERPGGGQP